ncbi:MAG: hypothetical protein AABY22_18840, partial [Nanoarchaeota archaeon]
MAKNRIIYQTENVYVGPSGFAPLVTFNAAGTPPTLNIKQLQRVQSANYGYTINRQDVNQFGELAA